MLILSWFIIVKIQCELVSTALNNLLYVASHFWCHPLALAFTTPKSKTTVWYWLKRHWDKYLYSIILICAGTWHSKWCLLIDKTTNWFFSDIWSRYIICSCCIFYLYLANVMNPCILLLKIENDHGGVNILSWKILDWHKMISKHLRYICESLKKQ